MQVILSVRAPYLTNTTQMYDVWCMMWCMMYDASKAKHTHIHMQTNTQTQIIVHFDGHTHTQQIITMTMTYVRDEVCMMRLWVMFDAHTCLAAAFLRSDNLPFSATLMGTRSLYCLCVVTDAIWEEKRGEERQGSIYIYICVCVCVWERERERERGKNKNRWKTHGNAMVKNERERERERER